MFIPNNLLDASTVVLSDRDRDALAEILQSIRRESIIDPSPTTYAVALRAAACLPLQAVRVIANLRYGVDSDLGIVVLRNTPLDRDIPRQPKPTRLWHDKRSSVSEGVHLAVHAAMGTVPFSYRAENDGATVATVCLRRGDLILIDNRIVAHGRVGFRADYDHPRITQRSFGCFDFAATRPARRCGSTILD